MTESPTRRKRDEGFRLQPLLHLVRRPFDP